MHVRCPHCHNPIEVIDDATLHDVECPSCGSNFSLVDDQSTAQYQPGVTSIAHFELIEQIGIGAFGSVWKARDTKLDRTVAIKIPRKDQLDSKESEQFLREARSAAQLKHANVVSVHEVGRENDQLYIVSDFVQGATLADWIEGQTHTSREAAELTAKIAEALQHAHEAGVIHRDLKPANIMMDLDGEPHIMDFGLAKREAGEITVTVDGKVLGTPAYMPPEQARGEGHHADARSDVYSLGVILFQLLTGELPFRGNPRMLIVQILKDDPPGLRKLNGTVSRDLETICLKCLEKEQAKRYKSAQALADDLGRAVQGEPIHARASSRVEKAVRWCKREPAKATAAIAILLLAIGGPSLSVQLILASRQAAISKVDALLNASPSAIPVILADLDHQAYIVRSLLEELDSQDLTPPQRIRVSLALLPYDPNQLDKLQQRLNDCAYDELSVVLDRLRQHNGMDAVPRLWTTFHSQSSPSSDRFRAGIALASLNPESDQWIDEDYQFLVMSMLGENTLHQSAIRQSLRSLADKLLSPVQKAFSDETANDTVRESAANAIVDMAGDELELLTELSMVATPKQHSILFPSVSLHAESNDTIVETFVEVTKLQPKADDNEETRVALGKRRAGAAINLLRMEQPDASLEVLRVNDDPESLTQFVHGCKDRGVTVTQLLNLFNRAKSVPEQHGILLALGEFSIEAIPDDIRSTWVDYVKDLYANDPSSGIHGVSGWLLRQWGYGEDAQAIDQRAVPYSVDREWFTLEINLPPKDLPSYFTFVVFSAGEYNIGVPEREQHERLSMEPLRRIRITRPFAMMDREITRGEYQSLTDFTWFAGEPPWQAESGSAMAGADWYGAVASCRAMTALAGFSETDQAYANPESLDRAKHDFVSPASSDHYFPLNWPLTLDRPGFRLPTAAEWEIACRGGTVTTFGFGSDRAMLAHYGWFIGNNLNRGHHPRELRPNIGGLFDMHGNMFEWCHDWYGWVTEVFVDPIGPPAGNDRELRGGGWSYAARNHRSANRNADKPDRLTMNMGFRVVLSICDQSSHPQ